MNHADLQRLTRQRVRDARALLNAGCHSGAYYLTGYAVECALKVCIAKQTRRGDFPELKRVQKSYTHDLTELVRVAGLEAEWENQLESQVFAACWNVVKDWRETSRYDLSIDKKRADDLYHAVTNRRAGVLRWIRRHW